MAKLYLRGQPDIEVSKREAKEIKDDWVNGILPKMVEIQDGLVCFKSSALTGVRIDPDVKENDWKYDINNPEHRKIIEDFEKEIKEISKEPYQIMIELKAGKRNALGQVSVIDPELWTDIREKERSLSYLKEKREFEDPSVDNS